MAVARFRHTIPSSEIIYELLDGEELRRSGGDAILVADVIRATADAYQGHCSIIRLLILRLSHWLFNLLLSRCHRLDAKVTRVAKVVS